jgi:hypothetical protein
MSRDLIVPCYESGDLTLFLPVDNGDARRPRYSRKICFYNFTANYVCGNKTTQCSISIRTPITPKSIM